MKNGMQHMTVKIDPDTKVNTLPLSRYQKLFTHKVDETRYPKSKPSSPITKTCISHDGKPKPFLGHFIAKVQHAALPRSHPVHLYVFEDATSLHILLSYVTSDRLGILEFKFPNLMAQSHIDTLTIPPFPAPSGLRRTAKRVTFCDPIMYHNQLCSTSHTQGLSGKRKTTALKVELSRVFYPCKWYKAQKPLNHPRPIPHLL